MKCVMLYSISNSDMEGSLFLMVVENSIYYVLIVDKVFGTTFSKTEKYSLTNLVHEIDGF